MIWGSFLHHLIASPGGLSRWCMYLVVCDAVLVIIIIIIIIKLAMIERDRASEFTPPETPSVFSPVHRNGDYSISKSVFGKHSSVYITDL